jgi:hypothetical protein
LCLVACGGDSKKPASDDAGNADSQTGMDSGAAHPDSGSAGDTNAPDGQAQSADSGASADAQIINDNDAGLDAASLPVDASDDDAGNDGGHPADGGTSLTDEQLLQNFGSTLRHCGIVTGSGTYNIGTIEDDFDRCMANCYDAPAADTRECAQMEAVFCDDHPSADAGVTTCVGDCIARINPADDSTAWPTDGFICTENNFKIPHFAVCDDKYDCSSTSTASDEQNCVKFKCKNGEFVSMKWHCDGLLFDAASGTGGCQDKSDENDCNVQVCK